MTKISDLTALTGASVDSATDLLPIVDMSLSGAARNKKITIAELIAAIDVPERARDALGAALVAGSNITITPNDGGDSITIAASGGGVAVAVEDEGTEELASVARLNFTGAGVSVTVVGSEAEVIIPGGSGYTPGGTDVALADGGTGASLVDPNADRILFWDDSAGVMTWLELHASLEISGTTLKPKHRGALVRKAADETAVNMTAGTIISWDTEAYDTDGFHDNSTNNHRLTVPSGATKVRLTAGLRLASFTADLWAFVTIIKNSGASFDGQPRQSVETGLTSANVNLLSPVIVVTPGDYFEVQVTVETDTTVDVTAATSWFAIEVIE